VALTGRIDDFLVIQRSKKFLKRKTARIDRGLIKTSWETKCNIYKQPLTLLSGNQSKNEDFDFNY
jgi:hypothetical protein